MLASPSLSPRSAWFAKAHVFVVPVMVRDAMVLVATLAETFAPIVSAARDRASAAGATEYADIASSADSMLTFELEGHDDTILLWGDSKLPLVSCTLGNYLGPHFGGREGLHGAQAPASSAMPCSPKAPDSTTVWTQRSVGKNTPCSHRSSGTRQLLLDFDLPGVWLSISLSIYK